jgi:hypothetical protein
LSFYTKPQTLLQTNENKKKLQEIYNKYRGENVKTKIIGNKLVFPNGNVYRDQVQPPRAEDILLMDDKEIEGLEETTVIEGDEFLRDGNTFMSLSSMVDTYAQVQKVYKKCFEIQILAVLTIIYWHTDSRIRRAKFMMDIVTMANTGPVDAC